MVNTKMLIGLGFIGVAVYAWSQLEVSPTQLPPDDDGQYVLPGPGGIPTPDSDSDPQPSTECNAMWDASGNRINDEWINHGSQQIGPYHNRQTCDLNGSDVKVYTDKSVYYAGEPINVYVLKRYYEKDWTNEWHKWTHKKSFKGETMKFFLGLEGERVLKSFTDSGGVTSSLPSSFDLLSPEQIEKYGVVKYRISTNSNSEGFYDLRFGTQLGPYQMGSACGSSTCLDGQYSTTKKCNVRETVSPTPIIVLSKDCKNPPQTSSAENWISSQSFLTEWM